MSSEAACEWIGESASHCARALRAGQVTARELVERAWEQIERVNPALNALVAERTEASLEDADRADRALRSGQPVGPLCGIPMSLKDSFDTCDLISTWGTPGRAQHVPEADATVVRRLRDAGAILLGKTNTPELTLSFHTRNALFGDTRNPYDLGRSPGGSSGGAAALVAARGVAFDLGSDTGGSIRLPAHFCGIAGLRPTSGRVPRTGHAIGSEGPLEALTQIGPLARHVEDLGLLLSIIAGPDARDPCVAPVPFRAPDLEADRCAGLRVLFHGDNGLMPADPAIVAVVFEAAKALELAGAQIEEAIPPGFEDTPALFSGLLLYDGGAWVRRILARAGTPLQDASLAPFRAEGNPPASQISALLERWSVFRSRALGLWSLADVVIGPVHAELPPPLESPEGPFLAYTYTTAYSLAGWPAAVVRAGTSSDGLPIGVQIVAPPWREDRCLAVARQIEERCGGYLAPDL